MLYETYLAKEKTYWWDEDAIGKCIFSAKDDEEARNFIATIVQRMNRKYWRMDDRRNVYIVQISRLEESGFSVRRREISLWNCVRPFQDFRSIRKALEAFYPKNTMGKRFCSIMGIFSNWKPISHSK